MDPKDHATTLENIAKSLRNIISSLQGIMSVLIKISKDKS